MGTFHVGAKIENILDRDHGATIPRMLVDTGSEYTWVPSTTLEKLGIKREKKDLSFVMANGQLITRSVGFAIVRVNKAFTVDEVVFAEKGDMHLLGGEKPRRPQSRRRFSKEEASGSRPPCRSPR